MHQKTKSITVSTIVELPEDLADKLSIYLENNANLSQDDAIALALQKLLGV
jgi:hypothetical protein